MRGDLCDSSLADVMRHLYAERKTGILRLTRGGVDRRVYFKKGVPIYADADDRPPRSREEATALLYSLFDWTSGELSFTEGETDVDESRAFDESPSAVILAGCRGIDDRRTLEHLVGGPESVFACTETSVLPLFTMKLRPEESAILKFAREHECFSPKELPFAAAAAAAAAAETTTSASASASPVSDDLAIVRALNALVSVGLLRITERAPASESVEIPVPAPTPQPPPPAAPPESSPGEVETLLDTFEAKRTQAPLPGPEPAIPPAPSRGSRPAPARTGRRTWVAATGTVIVVAGLVWGWLNSGSGKTPVPRTTVATEAAEPDPPDVVPAPTEPDPSPPTNAELFYAANLAFEQGDFDQSETELSLLLERQPDFAPARELQNRIDRERKEQKQERADRARASAAPKEAPKPPADKPEKPRPTPSLPAAAPAPPTVSAPPAPSTLLAEARAALERNDLETTRSKLDELGRAAPSYPGADQVQTELEERTWERKLPLILTVRHDHALGGCSGVLSLTANGYAYRSKDHEWVWSFAEIAETERRGANRLRIETKGHASFNFELKQPLSDDDWERHRALGAR